jgi:4-amino-4-deoxy-L-arabinose transferase-like glycosyltransferase
MDPGAAKIIAVNGTGEYFDQPTDHSPASVADAVADLVNWDNLETWMWPAYYMLAGIWCRLGKALGAADARLLYWIRFLNVPIAAAFVWLSWLFSRKFFCTNPRQRIALPILAAFFPQDIFFAITSDVLSPLVFAAAFFMLLEICLDEKSRGYHLLAGLTVAATFLTKASNIAILLFAAGVVLIRIKQTLSKKRFKQYLPSLVAFAVAAAVPIAFWLGRNYVLFGDFSGVAASIHVRTWTPKPFSEMFNHPIFTPSGLFYFLTELTRTFWRGEFVWRFKAIASPFMDWFYIISSAVFLSVSIIGMVCDKIKTDKPSRLALTACLFVLALSVLFLAVMSMRYDFGKCFYPSRDKPYFVSGRLIAGIILPFLLLYVDGLRRILGKFRLASCLLVVAAVIAAAITLSEIILSLPVFASPYNWFHLK